MKRKLFLAIAIGAMALTACNKEDCGDTFLRNETLSASLVDETAQTRTALNGLQVVWSANDKISVFAENGNSVSNNAGIIKTGVGTTSATFDVVLEGTTKLAAAYPYMDGTTYANEIITMNMPDSYTYVENGIGGAPMAAIISNQTSTIAFKNAGALMGLTVNNIPAGFNKAILTSKGDEAITGTCEITFDADSKPSIEATDAATGKVITINFDAAQTATNKTFYFPIPVGEYSSLELSISDGTETKVLKTKGLKAERSQRYKSTLTLDVVSGETPVEASSAEDASSKLQNSNSVNVTIPEDEDDPTILLPETNNDGPTTLSFEPIPDGKTVTIQATSDETNVSDDVNIAASSNGDSQNNNFNIQLPNSTVTLNANGDAATYNNVTAHTAANTLIIGKGVTVNNLVVEGGNVRVYGEVKNISRANNNDEVTVIFVEDGGIIPASIGEGFVVIYDESKWDGTSCYAPQYDEENKVYNITNGYELAWIANYVNKGNTLAGCTIVLNNDIDLNNKNWTPIGTEKNQFKGIFNGGNKTIKNLNIVETEAKEGKAYIGLFGYANNVTIKDVTFENVNINIPCLDIDHSQGHIGAVAGSLEGTSTIENVTVKGDITVYATQTANGASRVAVVAGGNSYGNVTMKNVHVIANEGSSLIANNNIGALAGQLQGKMAFENCTSNINVTANKFFAGGLVGIAAGDSYIKNCHTTGDVAVVAGRAGRANDHYRVGGIAGGWADGKTKVCTLENCSYTGKISGKNSDGSVAEVLDYAGYVGRGYTLTNCAGSKVIIDGVEYVQAYDKEYGVYTIDGVYEMKTLADMQWLANKVNTGADYFEGKTIKLANDIDLNNVEWTPIGTDEHQFKGTLDGGNKTIKNLNIVETEAKEGKAYIGLFGYANNVTIKDVTFENVNINIPCLDIDHSQGHIGAVAGSLEGTSTIENVTVKGDITVYATQTANGASRVAVVAGGNSYGNVTMKNVHVIANEGSSLIANNNIGALAGQLQGKMAFENCTSNINVTANKFFAGGLVGIAAGDSYIKNCHTTGDVAVVAGRAGRANDHYRVGGIAGGWADGKTKVCTLENCSYTGKISGKNSDGSVAEVLDYAGYVGRGYTLTNCAGSKVIIDGVEYVQAYDKEYGVYTIDGVYEMKTLADMQWLANKVNTGADYFEGKTIKLANDIDLNNVEWTPIGSASMDHGFMGNFDGNGKTIKNLSIKNITPDSDGYVYAGLFGVTEGTDKNNQNYIKNLTIENVNINTNGHIVAAAIAYPYYTTVENITVKGDINIKGGDYTAGVLAYTRRCVDAKNLTIAGNTVSSITGNSTIGGVISDIQMNGGLTANYSNFAASGLTIQGVKCVGGISGIISKQTLDGATVKNVTIVSEDARTGIVSGALGEKSTIKNISVTNVTGATKVVGATYDGANEVIVNGDVYDKAETNN